MLFFRPHLQWLMVEVVRWCGGGHGGWQIGGVWCCVGMVVAVGGDEMVTGWGDKEEATRSCGYCFGFLLDRVFLYYFGVVVFSWWVGGYGVLLCSLGGLVMEESRCFSGSSTSGVKFWWWWGGVVVVDAVYSWFNFDTWFSDRFLNLLRFAGLF
jgi:hypothetical protein